jgi:feruloyl esterase
MRAVTLITAVILAGCGGGDDDDAPQAPQASAESLCNAYLGRSIEGAVITVANLVAATATAPEYCVVRGEMPQDLDFEVRMPTTWNKRTLFLGGGGFDGALSNPDALQFSPGIAQAGYAFVSTNHGHDSNVTPGATFALDPQMLAEYAHLAVPRVMAPAKAILAERYGRDFTGTKTVYEGCSGGGRQGLIQAQRYPDLFDGIISRAPANAYTPQFLYYQKLRKALAQPGAALSAAKIQTIDNATMAKCDALDGLADKMIGRPEACTFDPAELACTGAETDSCLTPAQVESARTFYAPTSVANGRYTWPGFPVGGEAGVLGWGFGGPTALGSGYINYMVTQNPSLDWLQVDPAAYTSRIDQLVTLIDAVDPDLSRFKASGGKLILWTGLNDWLITANNATAYYQSVVQKMGGQAAADEFVEYYTSPSVQHCAGGTGADRMDFVGPIFDWIEKGIKPSTNVIVATQEEFNFFGQPQRPAGAPAPSRPVCEYPKYPKYNGSGDPNAAASFTCTAP